MKKEDVKDIVLTVDLYAREEGVLEVLILVFFRAFIKLGIFLVYPMYLLILWSTQLKVLKCNIWNTGQVLAEDNQQDIVELCKKEGLVLLADEVCKFLKNLCSADYQGSFGDLV